MGRQILDEVAFFAIFALVFELTSHKAEWAFAGDF